MMMNKRLTNSLLILVLAALLSPVAGICQDREVLQAVTPDSTVTAVVDSAGKVKKVRVYDPHKASVRSAILPGLGQIYNRKYWKLPIVYGALGTSGGIFVYNLKWYKRTRYAVRFLGGDTASNPRSGIHPDLLYLVNRSDDQTLRYLRNQYRQSIDYSALIFLLLWGLNVVDAAVDSHLKGFDVSPDLTLRFKPGFSDMANTAGMSLVLDIGKKKPLPVRSRF